MLCYYLFWCVPVLEIQGINVSVFVFVNIAYSTLSWLSILATIWLLLACCRCSAWLLALVIQFVRSNLSLLVVYVVIDDENAAPLVTSPS